MHVRSRFPGRLAFAALLARAGLLALTPAVGMADDGYGRTLFVSTKGSAGNPCSESAPCATIGRAVAMAGNGDTALVGTGTCHEDVAIAVGLTLRGAGRPTIDAGGLDNGIAISGGAAAGAKITGFTAKNATFEGILARQNLGVTIADNVGAGNDEGIFIASAAGLAGTVVLGHEIRDLHYAIFTLNVPPIPVSANHFGSDVSVPVMQQ